MMPHTLLCTFAHGGIADLYRIELRDGRQALLRRLQPQKTFCLREHLGFRNGLKIRAAVTPHKNIVSSIEWGYDFLRPYEIIEYIPGENLKILFNARNPMIFTQTAQILEQAASGLAWLHKIGYMHLDVKPENFLLQERGGLKVKLTDFDLSRVSTDLGPRHQSGTPSYMAPEQLRKKVCSPASDVFAFSIMAFQLFTGRMPFTGETPKDTLRHQASERHIPRPANELNPNIPPGWSYAIQQGLVKRPEQRIQDMNAFLDVVHHFQ